MNDITNVIKSHTSIRKFTDKPVTKEQIDEIVYCAMRGASAGNMMQYSIITIQDKSTLEKLSKSCDNQPFIKDAPLALLFVADNYKWSELFKSRKVMDRGNPYHKPQLPDFMLGIQDAMIAAQNSVIAAESMGLGTCYIGDIMENIEFHRQLFNLPDYTMPVTLIVIGNYDFQPALRPRFEKQHMVYEEVYPEVNSEFIDSMFAQKETDIPDFAQKFYSRKIEADFFKEMIRSTKMYISQWEDKD